MNTIKPTSVVTLPAEAAPRGVAGVFRALRHGNYRLFFAGQLISLVGTWMQNVAQGWLVRSLAEPDERALWLGIVGFLGSVPVLLFTLLGGVLADRIVRRKLIMLYQVLSMILALALWQLATAPWLAVWHIAALAFLMGTVNAFDMPARQSFVVEMVGKEDLGNAIPLNSAVFNGARLLGPAIAGMVIGAFPEVRVGTSICFLLNGLSYLAAIAALMLMRLPEYKMASRHVSVWAATRQGLEYVRHSRSVAALMVLVGTVAVFGWMYTVLLPVFAGDILRLGGRGFGLLVSANGIGALAGALTLAVISERFRPRKLLFTGIAVFSVGITVFGFSKLPWLSAAALAATGWGLVTFFATANTALQRRVPDELRGRVMSLYTFVFAGFSPFGSLLSGVLAQKISPTFAVVFGAAVCALSAVIIARLVPPTSPPADL